MLANGCVYSSTGSLCCPLYTDMLSLGHSIADCLLQMHARCVHQFPASHPSFTVVLLQAQLWSCALRQKLQSTVSVVYTI